MAQLKKANGLLKSAKDLYERDDLAGVAGLGYHAVESAINAMTKKIDGTVKKGHSERRKQAEEILSLGKDTLRELWIARNIDFYGNEKIGGEEKELDRESIKKSLDNAESVVSQVENMLKEIEEKNNGKEERCKTDGKVKSGLNDKTAS